VEAELKAFIDKENALTQLPKTLNVNDLTMAKQKARYAEELWLITQELALSDASHQMAM
jgi:hypothetical protein